MSNGASRDRTRISFLATASIAALGLALPGIANAQSGPDFTEEAPHIVVNDNINPNAPGNNGALDTGVTGIGQMITIVQNGAGAGLSLCSGTLVNPRTVIFAAHCVNTRPAAAYGSDTGISGGINGVAGLPNSTGTPISFGFSATNRCLGVAVNGCAVGSGGYEVWRNSGYKSQTDSNLNIFNVNQVWYDTRSLEPNAVGFLYADVAMATLDTPASDVPTWTMLFSPLEGPTHAISTGYGVNGTHSSAQGPGPCTAGNPPGDVCRPLGAIDYRRRAAENMLDVLGSLDDNDEAFFPGDPANGVNNPQALYQLDFDSPGGADTFNGTTNFDFNPFRSTGDGGALPREGTTAGGDSGGPLIVDQAFDRPTVVGVLSGGSRYFNGQRFSTYGTTSFYQPLYLYWEEIVANNPYVYATAKPGSREWTNPAHWFQDMDPSYLTSSNGDLVNQLPNFFADGPNGAGPKFGTICNGDDCVDISDFGSPLFTVGAPIFVAGGPGSQNFVPNNRAPVNNADPALTVKARYYDVTLGASGTTRLSNANITIDVLNVRGQAALNVASTGTLNVLGDFTQVGGSTNVDGLLKTGEAMVGGILSGSGRIDPTFLTMVGGAVIPGGNGTLGSLTVQGDMILSSGTTSLFDLNPAAPEKLIIQGDAQNAGIISLGGNLIVSRAGSAPIRANQRIEIITATGAVQDTFNTVISGGLGSLNPQVIYGPNNVVVRLVAGSLAASVPAGNANALAFANALDTARSRGLYDNLYGLFGAVDLMEAGQLTQTLSGLMPRTTSLAQIESDNQKSMVLGLITDRLSMLGTSKIAGGSFKIVGAPETLGLANGQTQLSGSSASQLSFARSIGSSRSYGQLPENVSGFLSGGYEYGRPGTDAAGSGGQRSTWHIAMGLEMEAATDLTIGTAFGYVNGRSNVTGTEAETRTTQATAYGSYRLSKNAYVAGLAAVTRTDIGVQRGVNAGFGALNLQGDTSAQGYDLQLETGYNLGIAKGLTLTPRAALRYSSDEIDGYRENGGELALMIDDLKDQRLEGRLGVRMSGESAIGRTGWSFAPELAVDQVQRIGGNGGDLTLRFANAAGIPIVVSGFSRDNSWTDLKGGLRMTNGKMSFGGGVESSIGRSDYRDNRAVADFTLRF